VKCTLCGAWTEVAETRATDSGHTLRRTRLCANGHRFKTFEVLEPIYRRSPPTVAKAVAAAQARAALRGLHQTWAKELKDGHLTHAALALRLGVSRQTVTKAMRKLITRPQPTRRVP